jgi:spore coat polysaccharide biosynthesis protein SpsF
LKIAILITARLKSTRLPFKVIKPLAGKPMIHHMIDRLKLAKYPSEIIICTSTVSQDDPLVEVAGTKGVKCYRGDPDDVLLRLTNAAREENVDLVINCTADNPFVDPVYIDYLVDYHLREGNQFTKIDGLPWGSFSYAINRKALEKACQIKDETDTEVWHGYFMETGHFKWGKLVVTDPAVQWPELRLTVDTPEDFQLMQRIFDELYDGENVFPLADIVALCRRRPELPAINSDIVQKTGIPLKFKKET